MCDTGKLELAIIYKWYLAHAIVLYNKLHIVPSLCMLVTVNIHFFIVINLSNDIMVWQIYDTTDKMHTAIGLAFYGFMYLAEVDGENQTLNAFIRKFEYIFAAIVVGNKLLNAPNVIDLELFTHALCVYVCVFTKLLYQPLLHPWIRYQMVLFLF